MRLCLIAALRPLATRGDEDRTPPPAGRDYVAARFDDLDATPVTMPAERFEMLYTCMSTSP